MILITAASLGDSAKAIGEILMLGDYWPGRGYKLLTICGLGWGRKRGLPGGL